MSVLVTGGAGYIGSHTVKALRASGADVVILDDLSAGHRAAAKALHAPLEEGSITDTARVLELMKAHEVNAVMHFAAWLSVPDSVKDPIGYYQNNVAGALSVFRAAVEAGVRHVIFSSTAATFGNPLETPITEEHPQRPINAYGETKLAVERALPHFERAYGLRSVVLRYFNAAGADPDGVLGEDHDPETHLIPLVVGAAQGRRPPVGILGTDYPTPDGTAVRDYIHVMDLADAHLRALDRLRNGESSQAINLGTGRGHSVREVVDAVARVSGRRVPVVEKARRPGDPAELVAAPARARDVLGWTCRYAELETIVRHALAWHEAHR